MKNLLFLFCLVISPYALAEELQSVSEINKDISALNTKIAEKEEELNKAKKESTKSITAQSELDLLKSKKAHAEANLKTSQYQADLAAAARKRDKSAKKDIKKQKNINTVTAVASGVAAAFLFTMCRTINRSDTKCQCAGMPYCALGALAVGQAAISLLGNSNLDKTDKEISTPDGLLAGAPDFTPACKGSTACGKSDIINDLLKDGTSKSDLDRISKLLGCKGPCLDLDSDGKIVATKKGGAKITKSDLKQEDVAAAEKAVNDYLNSQHKDLMAQAEELLEEDEGGLDTKKLVGGFQPGTRTGGGALAGNLDDGSENRKRPSLKNQINSLLSQFNKKKGPLAGKTVTLGRDQVGVIQDNIFLMVHRRYQERRGHKQFIERKSKRLPAFKQQI